MRRFMRRINSIFFIIAMALCVSFVGCGGGGGGGDGGGSDDTVILGEIEEFTIESESVGVTYSISVGLPLEYDASGPPYGSFFLLDGDWFFDNVHSMPEDYGHLIIIGINNSDRRTTDYIEAGTCEDSGGGHDDFLDFLVSELVPYLDSNYNIDPAKRFLYGWSHGGTFVFYTLFEDHGETFPRLMSVDASLRCLNILAQEQAYNSANDSLPVIFYASGATGGNAAQVRPVMNVIMQRNYVGFIAIYEEVPGGHEETLSTQNSMGREWFNSL